jgi:hypothetical protein
MPAFLPPGEMRGPGNRARDRSGTKNLTVFCFSGFAQGANPSLGEKEAFFVGADSPVWPEGPDAPIVKR